MSIGDRQLHYIRPFGKIKVPRPPRAGDGARRRAVVMLVGAILLGACAAGPRLEPVTAPADPGVTLTDGKVRWTVLPNTWSAYPSDLARFFTPVQVTIENARSDELQIRYEDFVALDDANQQYRAVPPGEVARAVSGALGPAGPAGAPGPILLAGPWYSPYRPRYWGSYYGPWSYPDPYYSPYAWPWRGAQEVLTLGLREGRLLAGASVQGFVFLQHATARGAFLTVFWTPRLAGGETLPTLAAQFRIAR
jgi:hypothetical protein